MRKLPRMLFVLSLLLAACAPGKATPEVATSTPAPPPATATSTQTPTATPQPTHTPTPTSASLSEEELQAILQCYQLMGIMQLNARIVQETATQVQAGTLTEADAAQVLSFLSGYIQTTEFALVVTEPATVLLDVWRAAIEAHIKMRGVMDRWMGGQANAAQVASEMEPILTEIASIIAQAESILIALPGIDVEALARARQEAIEGVPQIFQLTPTASP